MVGGRAFVKPGFDSEAGVSVLQVLDDGQIARRDLAIDARLAPRRLPALALTGFALFSLYEGRLGEAQATGTYQLGARAEITAGYRRLAPDLFLPRNSIFSVFSQETRDELGGFFYWRIARFLRLQGDYHVVVDDSGTGHDASAKLTDSFGREGRATVGVESRRLALPATGYTMARAFGSLRATPAVVATLDASTFFFDASVNGVGYSYAGVATVGYAFRPRWRAVATGIASVTPFAERRFEVLAKLVYDLSFRTKVGTP
jgi:hypothetical protein